MVKIADSEITVLKSSSHFVLSMSSHGLLYQAHVLSKFLNVVVSGCLISFQLVLKCMSGGYGIIGLAVSI